MKNQYVVLRKTNPPFAPGNVVAVCDGWDVAQRCLARYRAKGDGKKYHVHLLMGILSSPVDDRGRCVDPEGDVVPWNTVSDFMRDFGGPL